EVTTEATSTPVTTVEPVVFGSEAVKHLGDYTKDLDDMIITVEEAGYWRLLSNSVELSFNVGQLEALTAPASSSTEWSAGIAELAAATTRIIDAIDMDDYAPVRAEIDAVRGTVAALTEIASRP